VKIPTPRNQGYNGGYGGVGSKPTPHVWTPGGGASGRKARKRHSIVPRRLRNIRLRRTTRSRVEPTSGTGLVVLGTVALGLAYLFWKMLSS